MEVLVTAGFPGTHGNVTRKLLARHRQVAKTEGTHVHCLPAAFILSLFLATGVLPVSCQSDSCNTASGEPG